MSDKYEEVKEETNEVKKDTIKDEEKDAQTKKKSGSVNKTLVCVCIVLGVLVIGLFIAFIFILNKSKNNDSSSTEATTVSVGSETTTNTDADKEETTTEASAEMDASSQFVSVVAVNSWTSENRFYTQFSLNMTNPLKEDIENWTVELTVPDDTLVSDIWNGTSILSDGKLTISPVDYNNTIAAGMSVSDVGFIISSVNQEGMSEVCNSYAFFVNGEKMQNVVAETGTETEDKKDTETSTEEIIANIPPEKEEGTPFANHGKLSVKGTDIVDEHGEKYQLKGLSTHGIAWFPDYVNKDAFQTFRDDWNANLIRLAMYTAENNGYCTGGNKEQIKGLVCTGVEAATDLGMYVIVDWHILHDLNPQVYKEEAKAYFAEMSKKYKDYDNVIYEICNEPNGGTTWSDVKSYAEEVIPIIRENAPDAIIIVGTPTWSQDVDVAAKDPITGYDNIMYAAHFYATTHTDGIRNKVTTAIDAGLPVFISEFSICDASGNGAIDYNQADLWFDLIDNYNLSYAAWNISNKAETSSVIISSCNKTSGWTVDDLSDTGKWIRNQMLGN
ncbi:MAG: cellulase family glycosylhydrolase [Lachnospiraceae bacterium]|nr:cellulase family glycosylhydrolase [Lachnospiraceae bacterium]